MIVISAVFKAKPGCEAELESALRAMIAPVGEESGVLEYALHRAPDDAGRFFFFEKYRDQAAVDLHMATPYLKALLDKVPALCAGAPAVDIYQPLAAIKR